MRGSPITAGIAVLALAAGAGNAVAGYLENRAAHHQTCVTARDANAALRGLIDDFILQNPKVTPQQRQSADAIALSRFPIITC